MSEKELINKCKKGDSNAISLLYQRYAPKMLGVCFRYVGNMDTAQDLLHDGFIVAITKISSFRSEGAFEGWLRRIFVNTALSHLRANLKLDAKTVDIDDVKSFNTTELDALDKLSSKDMMAYMNKLPEGYRVVLNMFAVEGYSHKEIASELDITESTSRSQYLRAKAHLKKLLEKDRVI